jgi:putative OPT family oligopeptide transporter
LHPAAGPALTVATGVWQHQVRFIGAGAIGISAIWTLARLAIPVWKGLLASIEASRRRSAGEGHLLTRTERDIPIGIVTLISIACLIPMAFLLASFLTGGAIAQYIVPLTIAAVIYVVVAGFVVAAVSGYMAGLIGSSNSPVSGLAILAIIGASLLLLIIAHGASGSTKDALVAFALFVTAVVLAAATIANDNLQDLKTGQLVDATPWRQQVSLIVGVIFGSLVIPPVLNLLNAANGFAGAPHPHAAAAAQPLPAPQATLISALAKGVISGQIDWNLILIGVLVGIGIIAIDEILRATTAQRAKLPPLAVGLGIYLPMATTSAVVLGAIFGWFYNRRVAGLPHADIARRLGVLLASGLIVGESLFGVLLSGIIVAAKGNGTPLALVGDSFLIPSEVIGGIAFVVVALLMYRWVANLAKRALT